MPVHWEFKDTCARYQRICVVDLSFSTELTSKQLFEKWVKECIFFSRGGFDGQNFASDQGLLTRETKHKRMMTRQMLFGQ